MQSKSQPEPDRVDQQEEHENIREALLAISLSLQSASNIREVQEKVLQTVVADLGFPRAVVGLVDQANEVIWGWMGQDKNGRYLQSDELTPVSPLPIREESGLIAMALLLQSDIAVQQEACTTDALLLEQLQLGDCHIFPLLLREFAVGVMLVETVPASDFSSHIPSLKAIASQSAVALGTTLMCIDRAGRLAAQEERLRIAQDIHDSVSQSLFGIVFTLNGCLKLLPGQPEAVVPELERALQAADSVRQEIRHSILDLWPTQLTADRFAADLQQFASELGPNIETAFIFDIRGHFGSLSPAVRRSLYRISQEALANIVHHAQASEARVCIDVLERRAKLSVRDNGRGFAPVDTLSRNDDREHFGLRGMQERAQSLGGECHIFSKADAGTSIIVDIPL